MPNNKISQYRNSVLRWFKTNMKPTEVQFSQLFNWVWFKDEKIPVTQIGNLNNLLNAKADTELVTVLTKEIQALKVKKGLQFLEPISLKANTPIMFELPENTYFYGFEVIGTANVSVGTSKTSIDDIGEIDSRETPILETGLKKVLSVWFQADVECEIEPIIYIKP